MKCPFCGHEFEKGREACSGCPMHNQCKATCCPNCGYELERESKLAGLIKRLWKKKPEASDLSHPSDPSDSEQ